MPLEYCTRDKAIQPQNKLYLSGSAQNLLHHCAERSTPLAGVQWILHTTWGEEKKEDSTVGKKKTCFILFLQKHADTYIHRYVPKCMCIFICRYVYTYECFCELVDLHKCACSTLNHDKYTCISGFMFLFFAWDSKASGSGGSFSALCSLCPFDFWRF